MDCQVGLLNSLALYGLLLTFYDSLTDIATCPTLIIAIIDLCEYYSHGLFTSVIVSVCVNTTITVYPLMP